jgi:hypothetical protein
VTPAFVDALLAKKRRKGSSKEEKRKDRERARRLD